MKLFCRLIQIAGEQRDRLRTDWLARKGRHNPAYLPLGNPPHGYSLIEDASGRRSQQSVTFQSPHFGSEIPLFQSEEKKYLQVTGCISLESSF